MAILRTTSTLLAGRIDRSKIPAYERSALVHVIRRHGSREDAEAVLDAFLADPPARDWLLEIVRAHGASTTAARLHAACATENELRENVPTGVLRCLGHLRYQPAESLLWRYATAESSDHDAVTDACLGLLDLPCGELGPSIAAALSAYEGMNHFPELVPCLAVKTGNPLWIPRLVRWGRDHASTDCNGGLILGIAMFGERGRAELVRVLADPRWEADASATGSGYWAFVATRVLAIEIRELYAGLRANADRDRQRQALRTLIAMLDRWFDPIDLAGTPAPSETAADLLALLFTWSTPDRDDCLSGLTSELFTDPTASIHDAVYQLERDLRLRAVHELETAQLRSP